LIIIHELFFFTFFLDKKVTKNQSKTMPMRSLSMHCLAQKLTGLLPLDLPAK
jgi:hypothetical protein